MNKSLTRITLVLAALSMPALLTGCGSTSKAEKSTESMAATNANLSKGSAQVSKVLAALDTVVANKTGDMKTAYKNYGKEVDNTENAAKSAREEAEALKLRAKDQFDAWVQESQKLSSPEMQKANLARRDQAKAKYAVVQEDAQKVKAAYEPFITNLKDIRQFLSTDMTAHGVDALSKSIEKAHTDGATLKAAIAEMQKAMTEFKAELVTK